MRLQRRIKRLRDRYNQRKAMVRINKQLAAKGVNRSFPVPALFQVDWLHLVKIQNKAVVNAFFRAFLWVHLREETKEDRLTVRDHLGPIDTLGWQSSTGRFSGSFSEELGYMCWLQLGCLQATMYDGCGAKYLTFGFRRDN